MSDIVSEAPFSYVTHTFPQQELLGLTEKPGRLDLNMRGAVFVPDIEAGLDSRRPGILRDGFLSGQGVLFYKHTGGNVVDASFRAEFPSKISRLFAALGNYRSPAGRTPVKFKKQTEA